ncbi:hypothetical protein GCM10023238_25820 [Streptomyces heliomycini]
MGEAHLALGRKAPPLPRLTLSVIGRDDTDFRTFKGATETMAVSVTLPALGESVTEGTVTRWLKAEGERVEADEPLLEVSTDKVDTEIPAPASGVLSSIKVAETRPSRSAPSWR